MKLFLLIFVVFLQELLAKTIVDDYGREVVVPTKVTKIYAASPPLSMSLLAFDASLISGLTSAYTNEQKAYVGEAYKKPVVGAFSGQGRTPNLESLAATKPDVIIVWGRMNGVEKIVEKLESLEIPVLMVRNDTIKDLVSQFTLYAKLTGNTQRAEELIAYTNETLTLIDSLQEKLQTLKPTRYYFAEGIEGLNSECDGSFHLEPFLYSGGINALDCKMSSNYGMEKVTPETVFLSNPDVLVVMEKSFYDGVYNNSRFKHLEAVKNKRVYLVPSSPFNYITRPPSFMRLMGIRWLIHTFYPELLPNSLQEEYERFESIFFTVKR